MLLMSVGDRDQHPGLRDYRYMYVDMAVHPLCGRGYVWLFGVVLGVDP